MESIHATCIHKHEFENLYRITTVYNESYDISEDSLKEQIKNKELIVDNLALNSNDELIETEKDTYRDEDGVKVVHITRTDIGTIMKKMTGTVTLDSLLITPSESKNLSFKVNTNIDAIIAKSKLIDADTRINQLQKHVIMVETNTDVLIITDADKFLIYSGFQFFANTNFKSIDLTNIDTSKMQTAARMFEKTTATKLNLLSMNTSDVYKMAAMFSEITLDELDLSSFDTSSVIDMSDMFYKSRINKLNISSFNTSKVLTMERMFSHCKIGDFDLSSFDTRRVRNMEKMFYFSTFNKLDISHFRTDSVDYAENMIDSVNTSKIILGNFDTSVTLGYFKYDI